MFIADYDAFDIKYAGNWNYKQLALSVKKQTKVCQSLACIVHFVVANVTKQVADNLDKLVDTVG